MRARWKTRSGPRDRFTRTGSRTKSPGRFPERNDYVPSAPEGECGQDTGKEGEKIVGSRMIGLGMYAPPKTLTNDELEKMVDTSDSWITERTGIKLRRIAEPRTACSDLCLEALNGALAGTGATPPRDS